MINGKRGSGMRLIGLFAGAWALLLQVFAWTLTMPAQTAAGEWITICTAAGLVQVQVDSDGTPTDRGDPGRPSGSGFCPLCPLIAGLSVPPPLLLATPQTAVARQHRPVPRRDTRHAARTLSPHQARAPPALS